MVVIDTFVCEFKYNYFARLLTIKSKFYNGKLYGCDLYCDKYQYDGSNLIIYSNNNPIKEIYLTGNLGVVAFYILSTLVPKNEGISSIQGKVSYARDEIRYSIDRSRSSEKYRNLVYRLNVPNKLDSIKMLRTINDSFGLKEAKDLCDLLSDRPTSYQQIVGTFSEQFRKFTPSEIHKMILDIGAKVV